MGGAARADGHLQAAAVVLLAAVGVGQAVGDGLEAEPIVAAHGAGALGGLDAAVWLCSVLMKVT